MSLMVYNTLTRRKEPLEPISPGKIGIYLCGPTVYKPSHIGHAVGPIIFDAIKRYLVHRGYDVTWVVNITDVDDKLIIEAANQNTTTADLAQRVTKDYLDAMGKLHVDGIDIMPKASEHMDSIISTIERLIERGIAYESKGDVYFDVTKDDDYGKLSNRRLEDQEGQRGLRGGDKRHPGDFALWKAAKPEEPDEVKFDSPWGTGRPGWHIECSAMSSRYLGESFDIHGGGLDLVFPHHENEIAQSESATGKPFAKYWMHHGLTRFNTKKVAKSDADPEMQAALVRMTLHNLLDAYPGELIRFFVLSTQYRRPIEYSEEELESKRRGLETFYRLFDRVESLTGVSAYDTAKTPDVLHPSASADVRSEPLANACNEHISAFQRAMDDDFNTAGAIGAMFDLASAINRFIEVDRIELEGSDSAKRDALAAAGTLIGLGRVIGLFIDRPPKKSADDDALAGKAMNVLIQVRQHLRKKKDFETADMIRDLLADNRIIIEDRPGGTTWRTG
ncbi:MAG: cysteine--tRNA ligase [Phycisphaerae bacterium]